MKLAIVNACVSREGGGVASSVAQLSEELVRQGEDVRVFAFAGANALGDDTARIDERLRLFRPAGLRRFPVSRGMYRSLIDWSPDIIHLHNLWQYSSILSFRAHRLLKVPFLITPHGALQPISLGVSARIKQMAGSLFENRHLHSADCLHALTEAEVQSFHRYGLTNPVCVIPSGVDIPAAQPFQAPPWENHVEKGRRIVLSIGRFHPVKGLPNVLRAWALMKVSVPGAASWALVLAGWDTKGHESELRKLVDAHGLRRDAFFIGPVFEQRKQAALACANAVIVASISEGLPTTVLEGWAYSKPVLMTPACNLALGFERNAAIKIQPTPESIASGLQQLFTMSEPDRVAMGMRGLVLVKERFTWEHAGCELRAVYAWLLGEAPCPASVSV